MTIPSHTRIGGTFRLVHRRGDQILVDTTFPNGVTSEGLQNMWAAATGETIRSGTSQWYVGLIRDLGGDTLRWTDNWSNASQGNEDWTILNSLLGWGGLLDPITFDAASGGTITGSVQLQTVLTTTFIVAPDYGGVFITNVGTTDITSGVLWCTAPTSGTNATSGDIITVSYTLATSVGTGA